jgi:hypothetical protein
VQPQPPNTWVYAVDPALDGAAEIPPWAISGAFRVDETGTVGDELIPNPDYRPSPLTLGLPAPANAIEAALLNAATGYGSDAQVTEALLAGAVFTAPEQDDEPEVRAWTSDRYLPGPEVRREWQRTPVAELANRALLLNPGTELEARLPAGTLTTN